jgi:hypothetical protein
MSAASQVTFDIKSTQSSHIEIPDYFASSEFSDVGPDTYLVPGFFNRLPTVTRLDSVQSVPVWKNYLQTSLSDEVIISRRVQIEEVIVPLPLVFRLIKLSTPEGQGLLNKRWTNRFYVFDKNHTPCGMYATWIFNSWCIGVTDSLHVLTWPHGTLVITRNRLITRPVHN